MVVVQETETVFVDPKGGSSSGLSAAAKIGLGVAVPVVVLLAAAGVGLLLWRKRRAAAERRRMADAVAVEEHGGGGSGGSGGSQVAVEKDVGASKAQEPLTRGDLAAKEGGIVYGLQEVHGSNRSDSHEVHGEHTPGVQEVHGSHRSDSYEVHGDHAARIHEAQGITHVRPEMHGDHAARIHEAQGTSVHPELPGQPAHANSAVELPGSNGHTR